ncbi:MAG: 3-deoxy-D-manno-octulosonic acid transferase [Thermodesulfobacteriota bacterium]
MNAVYNLLLHLSLPFLLPYLAVKTLVTNRYRMGLRERFGLIDRDKLRELKDSPSIWIHAVSVGEVNAAIPLINRLRERYPERKIAVSTVTVTGQDNAAKKIPSADLIFFFPLDLTWVVRRVIRILRPDIFIVMETEIWPNTLKILHKNRIPAILVNGRISSASFRRYKRFRFFFKGVLGCFSLLSMQSERDTERIIGLGADKKKVVTSGNIKFDQTAPIYNKDASTLYEGVNLDTKDELLIAGSTHKGEDEIILDVFGSLKKEFPSLRLILAPRHPERFREVDDLVISKGFSLIRKTDLDRGERHPFDVILLDTIGELNIIYKIATIVFVGGSLVEKGGHNFLEPAVYGKPVLFGPFVDNFPTIANAMIEGGGGIKVRDGDELLSQIRRLLLNPSLIKEVGSAAQKVLEAGKGALDKNMELIDRLL